jgi:hypothetical protein
MKLDDPIQITPVDFAKEIDDLVRRNNFDHIQAIKYWSEKHNVNIEDTAPLINRNLKSRLQTDYESLHYLPRSGKLPI